MRDRRLERSVREYFVEALKPYGFRLIKIKPYYSGYPDELVEGPNGEKEYVELKRDAKARRRPIQVQRHLELEKRGHKVTLIATNKDVERFIDTCVLKNTPK